MTITQRFLFGVFAFCFVLAASMTSVSAATVSYDIGWTGSNDYSLVGVFSFADTSGPDIDEGDLLNFSIEGFFEGGSIGTFVGTPENFNFNADTGEFLIGGASNGPNGQSWNAFAGATGIGFGSNNVAQCLFLDGACLFDSFIDVANSTLVATPLPAALPLFLSVLAGIGLLRWRRRVAAARAGLLFSR